MRMVFMGMVEEVYVQTVDLACLSWSPWQYFRALHLTLHLSEALMGSSRANSGLLSPSYIFFLFTLEHSTNVVYRLLRETGRLSSTPIFVVGVFTGKDKLGEGFGSSLKMAEYRVRLTYHCPSSPEFHNLDDH